VGGGGANRTLPVEEYRRQPNINLTLCYPQGFSADEDGGATLRRVTSRALCPPDPPNQGIMFVTHAEAGR
ncbi:uncharacterized protein METZ01_LOCUS494233, partial [marine metagenome]